MKSMNGEIIRQNIQKDIFIKGSKYAQVVMVADNIITTEKWPFYFKGKVFSLFAFFKLFNFSVSVFDHLCQIRFDLKGG